MATKFKLIFHHRTHKGKHLITEIDLVISKCDLNDHDLCAIMFALEFSFNNHASEILRGSELGSVRLHVTELDV